MVLLPWTVSDSGAPGSEADDGGCGGCTAATAETASGLSHGSPRQGEGDDAGVSWGGAEGSRVDTMKDSRVVSQDESDRWMDAEQERWRMNER
jgi:hypothetical protein